MSDIMPVANHETAGDSDTYHDRDTLIRLAVNADRISGLFIALTAITGLIILVFLWWYLSGRLQMEQFIFYFLTAVVPFLLGGFFWIGSKLISEGIYILMDIEDNTRHPNPVKN